MTLIDRARGYLAANAAESGADALIAEMADALEKMHQADDALRGAYGFLASRYCHDNDGVCWSDSEAMQVAQAVDGAIHAIERSA